jgi:hypothetical protein
MIKPILMPERCFVDEIEYDQTVIHLYAEVDVIRDPDTGEMIPYNLRCSAEIQTANPILIAKLFEAIYSSKRINVQVEGRVRAEASDGLILSEAQYQSNELMANFKLGFGGPIRIQPPKISKKKSSG